MTDTTYGYETPMDLIQDRADDHAEDVVYRALALAEADDAWKRGAQPKTVAAAAMYAAYLDQRPRATAGEGRPTQQAVADWFDTNRVTLRERFNNLPEGL
jgi:transcription initiation factor TFIIIB Brf1 subunit/transcription initiation factor TFIIB